MEVTPEDLKFPKAVIARIIKDALPDGSKISKEAQCAIARSAAIFILHATSLANENAQSKKRKNVIAEDILQAVRQLDCEELEMPIIEGLEVFKKNKTDRLQKRNERTAKKREAERQQACSGGNTESKDDEVVEMSEEEEDQNEDEVEEDDDEIVEIKED